MLPQNIELNGKSILVTGAAGFIGSYLVTALLSAVSGADIVGVDNCNDYYDVSLKEYRLAKIKKHSEKFKDNNWTFIKGNIANKDFISEIFAEYKFDVVVNLAAQTGIRYSVENPDIYIESNVLGFYNILEACRHNPVEHLVFASSSSVYGGNSKVPFCVEDNVDKPVSLYAATKKSNELMAHSYAKLYNIPTTGLRFFTAYGPAGRPDMAYFDFTNKLVRGEKIKLFNYGNCKRDFVYIGDIIDGVLRVISRAPKKQKGADGLPVAPYGLYNIGGGNPVNLLDFVKILSNALITSGVLDKDFDITALTELAPMQQADIPVTFADTSALERDMGFKPNTSLETGLYEFAKWYKHYRKI